MISDDLKQLNRGSFDLAETLGDSSTVEQIPSFDRRSESELRDVARSHEDRVERERAIWEYAYRRGEESLPMLRDALRTEPDASVRWNVLWLALKHGREDAVPLLEAARSDAHREVRDWARVFLREVSGEPIASEYDRGVFIPDSPFDQTLPLQIAGFAILQVPGMGAMRATLSPLWFEQIMGRVLACTNRATFMRNLTIEKCLEKYHGDGSNHYEIFPFSGVSWATAEGCTQHRYESITRRTFYRSGKVEDRTKGVDKDLPVILNRKAAVTSETLAVLPADKIDFGGFIARESSQPVNTTAIADGKGIRLLNGTVVRTVRGQFSGWAHTSLAHYLQHNRVLPGTVQLVDPLHEATADLVNTYLCGTFRGKIGDHDGDGWLDVNLIPCHGTVKGELDYHADGTLADDPF